MLQAALALSSGSALSLLQEQEQPADDFGKLIEQAGLGEPALRTYPTTKQMKLCEAAAKCNKPLPYSCTVEGLEDSRAWVEGRTFAEWTSSFIKSAWDGLLRGRFSAASRGRRAPSGAGGEARPRGLNTSCRTRKPRAVHAYSLR